MRFSSLKGVQDIFPPEIFVWQHVENIAKEVFERYGYCEIRLPVIENTGLFSRSIGETSDIVEKEMYTFKDKGGRSVTLRPEGTAPFVRAFVQHHLHNGPSPQKYYYLGPMFRYERPQAYRNRQFYQIGIEALGSEDPRLDAEAVSMLWSVLKKTGLKKARLELTSIGCRLCRPDYKTALQKEIRGGLKDFCEDCRRRYRSNPLRILDCKVSSCVKARKSVPAIIDYLCVECGEHFNGLKRGLDLLKIPYTLNSEIVRGLDYYTRTAFEVTSESLGSQKAVAAGGRYDMLVKEFGGPQVPGIGFAIGMERLVPLVKDSLGKTQGPDLFFCPLGRAASEKSFVLAEQLRSEGLRVEINYDGSSLRSQMRKADRINAKSVIVLGDDELRNGTAALKDMLGKKETAVRLKSDDILKKIKKQG